MRRAAGRVAVGLTITVISILLTLGAIEIGLRCCYADSAGTLTYLNWQARYWSLNAQGYRDAEWRPDVWRDRTTIAVIGDSFTAGWGIPDPADRFPDRLAALLGDEYAVINLGISGSWTAQQIDTLSGFPAASGVTPDVVILQYFLNDIDGAFISLGLPLPPAPDLPLAHQLYLADFIYTRIGRDGAGYWREHYIAYDSPPLWEQHARELHAFIDAVEAINARLIVVIFPNMTDPVASIAYVDRVAQVFQARGHTDIVKLFDDAAAWQPADRVVSPRDSHASAAFHGLVADRLLSFFSSAAS